MSTPVSSTGCSLCGRMLEREGACLECLLRGGLDESEKEPLSSNSLVFGDFEIERRDDGSFWELGRGAMGVTYRAQDKMLHRPVALKVIEVPAKAGGAHAMRERFLREARAAAALRHANVASVFQFGASSESDRCYYAMELVEGETLATLVRRDGPLPVEAALEIAIQVTHALVAAAAHGLIHRDLKPANIMLAPNDAAPAALEAKVIDFGLAKATAGAADQMDLTHGAFVGTPTFASPEQFAGKAADARSDIYSLGVTFWYALTGEVPYPGKTIEEIRACQKEVALPVQQLSARKVPAPLIKLLRQTLAINPVERPQSARALLGALELCRAKMAAAPRRRRAALLYGLLAIGAVGLTSYLRHRPPAPVIPPEKSIAVLPFENRSTDQANAYFADGIQDEILTRLSKIADLKVISRTSTQRYQSKPRNLREIAKQLGVANIVEGSVQKAADQVRVSVQLINAQTDSHLWAETFDRKLTDIFGVESEIAKGIAESLQAKLTGREEQALAVKPTNNPEAYDLYLRGLSFEARSSSAWEAASFYERTVQLDPNFAIAWARLSRADADIYFDRRDTTPGRRDAAKRALENAQKLQPNSPETLLALGYYQYRVLRDYGAAKTTFERINKMLPGSSEVPYALAEVARREGHWDQSIAYFEQALALDPRDVELLRDAALTYSMLRQFPVALKLYDRALDVMPNDPEVMAAKANIYQAQGNLQEAARFLSGIDWRTPTEDIIGIKINQLRLERNYGEAIRLLQARLAQFHFESEYNKRKNQVTLADMQRLAGDTAGAKATVEQARNTLESVCKNQPDNAFAWVALAAANALIGERDLALEQMTHSMTLLPSAKDPMMGPALERHVAYIQTILGETSRPISTLARLLQTPGFGSYGTPITPALLRLDPVWDSLRTDPAFQKLCEEKIDKSIAVLPFENLSRDPDNAYFAEGIQEEILTRLAKIADLKVISRTSTQRYQSKPRDLGEIAKQLGVANVLEGSVQKVADQVRVNVKLINAQTDAHLWADTYDRQLTDILLVESEIAKGIAESLQAKLTGREKQALAVKSTNNPDAYDAYLRGLSFEARSTALWEAADFYERAVQLDPNFALAWARLSRADADLYLDQRDTTPGRRDAAKRALENAQKLAPDLPETLLALGYYQYRVLRDYEAAITTFGRVSKTLPGSTEVPYALAEVARHEGHWDQSITYYEQAIALDPRNVELLRDAALTYSLLRQFPAALKLYDRALDIMPNDPDVMAAKANIYQAEGNLQEAARFLSGIDWRTPNLNTFVSKILQLRLERNYGEAIRLLQARLAQFHFDSQYEKGTEQVALADTQRLAGDTVGAKLTAEQGHNTLEPVCKNQPDNPFAWASLALANALKGERDLALKQMTRSMTLLQSAKDPMFRPALEKYEAHIQTILGETGRPISTLARLLKTPGFALHTPITPGLLRLDPVWDPLRTDPAFQELCEEKKT